MTDDFKFDADFSLYFSEESKKGLELPANTDVRVVARTGRMILLETGEAGGSVLLRDRDLVLSCDVQAFPLADLLSLLYSAGKSGLLLFEVQDEAKAIYLKGGEVVFATSNLPADRLGECLLRAGRISHDQLELTEKRFHPGTRFGKIVVELGILTPRDLWNGVKSQVEEIVRSLFSYSAGWIHFWEGNIEPDNVVRLSLPTNRLIGEGLERRDELLRFLAKLEEPRARIRVGSETRPPVSENERAIMDALDDDGLFHTLCQRSGQAPRLAARTLLFLHLTGRIKIEQDASEGTADYSTADDDVVREAVALYGKILFDLCAPLVALDGAAAVAERLNRVREESAASGRALLDRVEFNSFAVLDPGELEYRALRLPSDRAREVDEALGEIVDYLEFELKNHPQIEDCRPFLAAVEPLRAMLIR